MWFPQLVLWKFNTLFSNEIERCKNAVLCLSIHWIALDSDIFPRSYDLPFFPLQALPWNLQFFGLHTTIEKWSLNAMDS